MLQIRATIARGNTIGERNYQNVPNWAIWLGAALGVFAVCMCLTIGCVLCRKLATSRGTPIRGTAWMMPPSYRSGLRRGDVENPVPEYNEQLGDNDAGHYDENGNFIARKNSKGSINHVEDSAMPPAYINDSSRSPSPSPPAPPAPAQRRRSDDFYDARDMPVDTIIAAPR